jgi:hypothetical protein
MSHPRDGEDRRREAQLRREAVDRYPTVPARMWTHARRLEALLMRSQQGRPSSGRIMSEDDFEFRVGGVSRGGMPGEGTRRGEPGFALQGERASRPISMPSPISCALL